MPEKRGGIGSGECLAAEKEHLRKNEEKRKR